MGGRAEGEAKVGPPAPVRASRRYRLRPYTTVARGTPISCANAAAAAASASPSSSLSPSSHAPPHADARERALRAGGTDRGAVLCGGCGSAASVAAAARSVAVVAPSAAPRRAITAHPSGTTPACSRGRCAAPAAPAAVAATMAAAAPPSPVTARYAASLAASSLHELPPSPSTAGVTGSSVVVGSVGGGTGSVGAEVAQAASPRMGARRHSA